MEYSHEGTSSSIRPARQAAEYFDRLFGQRSGTVRFGIGLDGHINDRGTYETKWRECSYEWPEQRRQLRQDAIWEAPDADVYVRTTLRGGLHPGQKGNGLGGQYCWADLDQLTSRARMRLPNLLSAGSFIVHSGQPDHIHPYIKLDAVYPADVVEGLNRQFDHYLDGGGKWAENTVLRVPGTLNHKGRAAGEESYPVTFEDVTDSEIPPWSPKALSEVLGPLPAHPTSGRRRQRGQQNGRRNKGTRQRASEIVPVDPEPVPSGLPDEVMTLVHFSTKTKPKGDYSRSGQLYRLVVVLIKQGCTDGEIMGVALYSEPGQDKYPNEEDLKREIQRCINKIRPVHNHPGCTCNEVACQVTPHPEILERTNAIREHFHTQYGVPRTLSSDAKVLEALLRKATLIGDLELDMSRRDLCQGAGVCRNTADRSLDRLIKGGYVEIIRSESGNPLRKGKGDPGTRAYRYRLLIPDAKGEPHSNTNTNIHRKKKYVCTCGSTSALDPSHDVWRYQGLGPARLTYQFLLSGISTAKQIAELYGRTVKTINGHLESLAQYGLAERKPDGRSWIALDRDLDELAEELGTLGIGKERSEQYAYESKRYLEHLSLHQQELRELEEQSIQELIDIDYKWVGPHNNLLVPPDAPDWF